ncbi:MAG: hypothetical protein JNL39_05740 [Opitutaceae bacterium]|nr:hypothetical protein [Opitutaceae bacterium]
MAAVTCSAQILTTGPFAGFDLAKADKDLARAVREASEDFERVLTGLAPLHAVLQRPVHGLDDPRREVMRSFKGHRYHLAVVKWPLRIGETEGLLFGPQINFVELDFGTNLVPIPANQRFYTRDALAKLLKGEPWWTMIPTRQDPRPAPQK